MPRTWRDWVLCLRGGNWVESLDQLGRRPHLSGASNRGRALCQARVWGLDAALDRAQARLVACARLLGALDRFATPGRPVDPAQANARSNYWAPHLRLTARSCRRERGCRLRPLCWRMGRIVFPARTVELGRTGRRHRRGCDVRPTVRVPIDPPRPEPLDPIGDRHAAHPTHAAIRSCRAEGDRMR